MKSQLLLTPASRSHEAKLMALFSSCMNAENTELAAVWEAEGVLAKWETSSWAKKLRARKLRAEMTDFDRFQVMLARKERSAARKAAVGA
eukprot:1325924-Pleurochrysis_carterae.AAC.4